MSIVALVLLTIVAQVSSPKADPQAKLKAQGLLNEGSAFYERGDYATALEKFNAAYATYPSPKLMFNIGQANRDLSRPVEALDAFEKFLTGAADASPETIADARRSVTELRQKLGQIRIECDRADAEVSLDGKSVGRTPLREFVWTTPGHHQVTASHAATALALENVEVAAGVVQVVVLQLHALAAPRPETTAGTEPAVVRQPEAIRQAEAQPASSLDLRTSTAPGTASSGWWLGRTWTWVAAGSTVLLAAGAVTAGLTMHSKFDSLDKSCGDGNVNRPGCSESDISGVHTRALAANVLWGLTGAAALTTGVLFFVEGRSVSVAPIAGETTGLSATVRY
jgi:hypothetical protein